MYDPAPRYAPRGGTVDVGWDEAAAALSASPAVLAIDGPAVLDWEAAVDGITRALARRGIPAETLDMRLQAVPWEQILARTASAQLLDDPEFATLASGTLAIIFDHMPATVPPAAGLLIVFGPGSALVAHDVLWYADLPKRFAESAVKAGTGRNLGQTDGALRATTRQLFYVDWPLLDRHRDAMVGHIDRFLDLQDPTHPSSLDGATLRQKMLELVRKPFRTRPTFASAPWGGHWAQHELRMDIGARNTALGYEL